MICRLSRTSGSVRGGDEVFLLCTGIKKGLHIAFYICKMDFSLQLVRMTVAAIHLMGR